MAGMFKSRDKGVLVPATPPPKRSLIASAAEITLANTSWNIFKLREESWQRELWRLYDLIGEYRFAANWVGSCCSRVRIYVAEVDKFGRIGAEVKNKPKIAALADTVLGGPASKSEKLRSIGISLVVAGECYVLGISADDDKNDHWYVVSPSELHRITVPGTNEEAVLYGDRRLGKALVAGRDILIRLWTPHPRRMFHADSPSRAATPVLREVEQLTKYVFSQIDSRLIGAGMLPIPNNMEFPTADGESGAAESIMRKLAEAGQASLKGEGTAAAVLPIMVEMPIEALDKIKLVRFDSELSGQALDLRKEAIGRLALAMDMPPEVLLGSGDTNHWCKTDITEAFTKNRGWVRHEQLQVGDEILTLNHQLGTSEWQPVRDIYRADVIDEPMLHLASRSHDSMSTAGHRWPVFGGGRDWTTSVEGFRAKDKVPLAAVCTTVNTEPKYSDDFVRLVAAFTSDGTVCTNPSGSLRIRIAKFQQHEIVEMRRILTSVYGSTGFSEADHPTSTALGRAFNLRVPTSQPLLEVTGPNRMVLRSFINSLTLAQLDLFLESMISIGDGVRVGSARVYYQVDPRRLEAVEQAAILAGYKVTRGVRSQQTGFGTEPLSWVQVSSARHYFSPEYCTKTWEEYTGTIWCPTTDNGTWLARSGNSVYFTGNSAWFIEESAVKAHIEPLMTRICEGLTLVYLRSALTALGEDPDRYTFWYDTSPLTVRPQRLQDTLNLHKEGLVSAAAVLASGNYLESDAPSEEEDIQRFIRELMLRDPTLWNVPGARELAGITEEMLPADLATPPPPPPPPEQSLAAPGPDPMPDTQGEIPAAQPDAIVASAAPQITDLALVVAANSLVIRALEVAGARLLNRPERVRCVGVPRAELHTMIKVQDQAHATRLLDGAWTNLGPLTELLDVPVDVARFQRTLDMYTSTLLTRQILHDPNLLAPMLHQAGLLRASV